MAVAELGLSFVGAIGAAMSFSIAVRDYVLRDFRVNLQALGICAFFSALLLALAFSPPQKRGSPNPRPGPNVQGGADQLISERASKRP